MTQLARIFAAAFLLASGLPQAILIAQPGRVQPARMRIDLDFLCSDALAGRLSLDRSADVSAEYIAAEFKRTGLQAADGGSYLQAFPLIAYEADRAASSVVLRRNGKSERLSFGSQVRGDFQRDVTLRSGVVFAGYGITAPEYRYDDYAGIDLHGKVALIFDHEPRENDPQSPFNGTGHTIHANRQRKILNAQAHGAVALLIAGEPNRKHPGAFDAPSMTADGRGPRRTAPVQALAVDHTEIPALSIADAVAAKLFEGSGHSALEWQARIDQSLQPASKPLTPEIEIHLANKTTRRALSYNAIGLLEGSDPVLKGETIILNAHYDHLGADGANVYRGANDNASGTVAVMELARIFAAAPVKPKRSILFVVFGSEEEGLLGAYYYAAHPLRPLDTTRAVINLDMIARDEQHIPQSRGVLEISPDTSNEINLVGGFAHPELGAILGQAANEAGLTVSGKFDADHSLNVLFRCDHFPFLLRGVPAVWVFGGFHPGYHETSDTVEKLNFVKLEKTTRMAALAAAAIAGEK